MAKIKRTPEGKRKWQKRREDSVLRKFYCVTSPVFQKKANGHESCFHVGLFLVNIFNMELETAFSIWTWPFVLLTLSMYT